MTADERRAVPGLTPARADIIVAGAAILEALMEDLGIETIVALDDCGLREGLLLDDLGRAGQHELRHGAGVRERSVLQLARSTSFDETHARQVARLALELFDSAARRPAPPPRPRGARAARVRRPAPRHRHVPQLHAPPPAHLLPHPARRPRRVRPGGDRDHGGHGLLPPQGPPRSPVRGLLGAGPPLAQDRAAPRRASCGWRSTSTAATPGRSRTRGCAARRTACCSSSSRRATGAWRSGRSSAGATASRRRSATRSA